MRAKFIPLILLLTLAFIINVNALDVKVPESCLPLLGADSSILANAYETYSTSS